jgi:hypothetical protein
MMASTKSVGMAKLSLNSDLQSSRRALAFVFGVAVLDLLGLTLLAVIKSPERV